MKTTPIYFYYTIAFAMMIQLSLPSCVSMKHSIPSPSPDTRVKVSSYPTDFTNYLKSFSCLEVSGHDANGQVRIKGMQQIRSKKGPLFVVDDVRMGHDLTKIALLLDIEQIAKLKVLRHPAELSLFGADAMNGVIFIELLK